MADHDRGSGARAQPVLDLGLVDVGQLRGLVGVEEGRSRGGRSRLVVMATPCSFVRLVRYVDGTARRGPGARAVELPALLYPVFETVATSSPSRVSPRPAPFLESSDLPSVTGAHSDQGEIVSTTPGDLFVTFRPPGTRDPANLEKLMRGSRGPQRQVDDRHQFTLQGWSSS